MGSSLDQAEAAGVPPAFAQGFSEIVKAVTPAVVNIAVTGGGEGRREGRRQLPPGGPFGGPPPVPVGPAVMSPPVWSPGGPEVLRVVLPAVVLIVLSKVQGLT